MSTHNESNRGNISVYICYLLDCLSFVSIADYMHGLSLSGVRKLC